MGKQTHVVRARIEEMHEKLGAYEERQKQLQFQLAKIQEDIYQVHAARRGLLLPSLLTSEQMEPVLRGIQHYSPSAVFTISGPRVDIEDPTKTATTTII